MKTFKIPTDSITYIVHFSIKHSTFHMILRIAYIGVVIDTRIIQ